MLRRSNLALAGATRGQVRAPYGRKHLYVLHHEKHRNWNQAEGIAEYQLQSNKWHVRDGERWWIYDVAGEQLTRSSVAAAHIITGQHRPDFTPGILAGDQLVVVNVKDMVMVGDDWVRVPIQWANKFPSGQIRVRASEMYDRDPLMLFWYYTYEAVRINFNAQSHMFKAPMEKLWLYEDAIHPHMDKCPRPYRWIDPRTSSDRYVDPDYSRTWNPNPSLQ